MPEKKYLVMNFLQHIAGDNHLNPEINTDLAKIIDERVMPITLLRPLRPRVV